MHTYIVALYPFAANLPETIPGSMIKLTVIELKPFIEVTCLFMLQTPA